MIKIIGALFRIRKLIEIERMSKLVTDEIDAYDRALNGTPPLYNDSRPPNGDDYNALLSITEQLRENAPMSWGSVFNGEQEYLAEKKRLK